MPNRTYIDLKNDMMRLDSVWQDIANRYDTIPESLTSSEVDVEIKNTILYSIYNAKSWYATYLLQYITEQTNVDANGEWTDSTTALDQSIAMAEANMFRLTYWVNRTNDLISLLESISAQNQADFWGYKERYSDWQDNLYYNHLRLIDETYGNSVERNREIFDSVTKIDELNDRIEALHTKFRQIDWPYQIWQTKTTDDIDYSKINAQIIGISNNTNITLDEEDFSKAGVISSLKIPELQEGTYILKITNRNSARLSNITSLGNGWYNVTTNKLTDLTGWLIENKYPIFKSELSSNPRDLKIYLSREIENKSELFAYENYINDVSFLIDCKLNVEDAVYNFFYGTYLDEYIDTLDNGNHIYRRSIKDSDGNVKATYQIELDFSTKTESGMPVLHYLRTDL